jgi:hypothetical protein
MAHATNVAIATAAFEWRGGRGGQQGERAGGGDFEVFEIDYRVDASAQFHRAPRRNPESGRFN